MERVISTTEQAEFWTHKTRKKKRIYKSWRSHDILDGSEDMNWVQEAEADTLEQVEDNTE